MKDQMRYRFLVRNLVCIHQSGHSTTSALVRVCEDISIKIEKGIPTIMFLLDYSNAFDVVPHNLLVNTYKSKYQFSGSAYD